MQRILNFRTLAKGAANAEGKIIKPNTIFRSGVLSYASKGDIKKLVSYGIGDVYDFRNEKERVMMPPLPQSYLKTHAIDILEDVANTDAKAYLDKSKEEIDKGVIDLYSVDFVNTDKYSEAIANIVNQKSPQFLFHCTAGKDRTGIFGALIMMMLDFDMETIKREYLILSKRAIRIMAKQMLKKTGVSLKDVDIKKFEGVLGVFPEFFDAYLESMLKKYGRIDDYLEVKAGITPDIREYFRRTYLIEA